MDNRTPDEKENPGNYSQIDPPGNYSQVESIGNYSQVADPGNYSVATPPSAGNYSQVADAGNYSVAPPPSAGNYSQVADAGNYSVATPPSSTISKVKQTAPAAPKITSPFDDLNEQLAPYNCVIVRGLSQGVSGSAYLCGPISSGGQLQLSNSDIVKQVQNPNSGFFVLKELNPFLIEDLHNEDLSALSNENRHAVLTFRNECNNISKLSTENNNESLLRPKTQTLKTAGSTYILNECVYADKAEKNCKTIYKFAYDLGQNAYKDKDVKKHFAEFDALMIQLQAAQKQLHESGFLHCDSAGRNIMKTADGVKLIDFGASLQIDPAVGVIKHPGFPQTPTPIYDHAAILQAPDTKMRTFSYQTDHFSLKMCAMEMMAHYLGHPIDDSIVTNMHLKNLAGIDGKTPWVRVLANSSEEDRLKNVFDNVKAYAEMIKNQENDFSEMAVRRANVVDAFLNKYGPYLVQFPAADNAVDFKNKDSAIFDSCRRGPTLSAPHPHAETFTITPERPSFAHPSQLYSSAHHDILSNVKQFTADLLVQCQNIANQSNPDNKSITNQINQLNDVNKKLNDQSTPHKPEDLKEIIKNILEPIHEKVEQIQKQEQMQMIENKKKSDPVEITPNQNHHKLH